MIKEDKNRKILIIITAVLLVALIIVGIVMLLSQGDKKEKCKDKNGSEDFRCVESLCISKVAVEDNEGSKSIFVALKNEGTEKITKQCVKLSTKETSFNFCANELNAGDELSMAFEYSDQFGTKLDEYKLEKGAEEGTVNEEPVDEATTETTTVE